MLFLKKLIAVFSGFLFFLMPVSAQDSLGAIRDWKTESKKLEEGKYELTFTGTITGNWQVYAPNQTLLEVNTTELKFADSSIQQQGDFKSEAAPKEISSVIFENTKVSALSTTLFCFARKALQQQLPTAANLLRWGKAAAACCTLCKQTQTNMC